LFAMMCLNMTSETTFRRRGQAASTSAAVLDHGGNFYPHRRDRMGPKVTRRPDLAMHAAAVSDNPS